MIFHRKSFVTFILALLLLVPVVGGVVQASPAEQQAQFDIPRMVVNTSFLNIRTGPGVQYTVLVTVVGGTELPVLGVADDQVWYLVATPVGNGWVNVDYVIARGDFRNVPLIDPAVIAAPIVIFNTPGTLSLPSVPGVVVVGQGGGSVGGTLERFRARLEVEAVNVRTAPSESASSITTIFRNPDVDYRIVGRTVDSQFIEWLAIEVPGFGSGWVDAPKLFMALSARSGTVLTITEETVAVRSGPGGDSLNLPFLNPGYEVFLRDITADRLWLKVELPEGQIGYIPFGSARQRTTTTTDLLVAQGGAAAVQTGTAVNGVIVGTVGQVGLAMPRAIVNTGNLNIRSGPGAEYTSVAVVPGGTELAVLGIAADEVWYLVQGSFGQGWINEEFVIFRGVFDNVPVIR